MNDDIIFLAGSRNPHSRQRIDKYLHGYATLQFMESGAIEVGYDDHLQVLEGAWFWPAMPGPRIRFHAAVENDAWFHRHLAFQGARVERWMAAGWWPRVAQRAPNRKTPQQWGETFDVMTALAQQSDEWSRQRALNMLEAILLELAQERTQSDAPNRLENAWLEDVLHFLNAEEQRGLWPDYETMARHFGVSTHTLRRRFKAATGASLHDWVMQNRLAQARALLRETDLPLKSIAAQLGYSNVYFFARQFRALARVSPGVYRRSRQ